MLASRKPRHPVGWLLLAVALSLTATAAAAQYLTWGLLVRPGVARRPLGIALLLGHRLHGADLGRSAPAGDATGSLPSPRWRWWARVMVAAPVLLVVVATLAKGPLDPRYEALGGPFDLRGHGGVLLVANQLALAGLAVGLASASTLLSVAVGRCLAALPVATGAAVLRYGLYDLDRIIIRTPAYGSLTVLLGLGYAGIVRVLARSIRPCSRPGHRCGCGQPKLDRAHDQGADL